MAQKAKKNTFPSTHADPSLWSSLLQSIAHILTYIHYFCVLISYSLIQSGCFTFTLWQQFSLMFYWPFCHWMDWIILITILLKLSVAGNTINYQSWASFPLIVKTPHSFHFPPTSLSFSTIGYNKSFPEITFSLIPTIRPGNIKYSISLPFY